VVGMAKGRAAFGVDVSPLATFVVGRTPSPLPIVILSHHPEC